MGKSKLAVVIFALVSALASVYIVLVLNPPSDKLGGGFSSTPAFTEWRTPPANDIAVTQQLRAPLTVQRRRVESEPTWLILVGTELAKPGDRVAYIGINRLAARGYRVGALLANSARVTTIEEDRVTLERNGVTGYLYKVGRRPVNFKSAADDVLTVGGKNSMRTSSVADSTDSLTDVIRISPSFEGTIFRGLVVYANPRSDLFSRLGFQPRDIVTAVDGTPFVDQVSGIAAMRNLYGKALDVTVDRDGVTVTFPVDGTSFRITQADTT